MPNTNFTILYLVHDLSDAAVHKRVKMLQDGGATVLLAGFARSPEGADSLTLVEHYKLGHTYNGQFIQRIFSVAKAVARIHTLRKLFSKADIVIARNLEMLSIAVIGMKYAPPNTGLVYESLDIHKLLLRRDIVGVALRHLEGLMSRRASLLITSSPAFVQNYFSTMSSVSLPIRLIENKVYNPEPPLLCDITRAPTTPWKIGWFGAIRCHKSLKILSELSTELDGRIKIILRGKPALDQFDNFYDQVKGLPHLEFLGPYKSDDLAAIYSEVHFTWAIDKFEEGLNSAWLLPNRLYEGGLYGSVPIAEQTVETGRFIQRLGVGVLLSEPLKENLRDYFLSLTAEKYSELSRLSKNVPAQTWAMTLEDSKSLVEQLKNIRVE